MSNPVRMIEVDQGWPRRILALLFGRWDTVQIGYRVHIGKWWRGVFYCVYDFRMDDKE